MATPYHLQVVTPERVLFDGQVDELSMRTDGGEIAFLANHEDYVGAVDITVARLSVISDDGESSTEQIAVHGGFVHVNREGVTLLAGVAERGEEIDVDRARRALTQATARLEAEGPATVPAESAEAAPERLTGAMVALLAPESAQAAVARAEARLEAAGASASGS